MAFIVRGAHADPPEQVNVILNYRFLPAQRMFLVIRKAIFPPNLDAVALQALQVHEYPMEMYDIPPIGLGGVSNEEAISRYWFEDALENEVVDAFFISDPTFMPRNPYEQLISRTTSALGPDDKPPFLQIFYRTMSPDSGVGHICMWPVEPGKPEAEGLPLPLDEDERPKWVYTFEASDNQIHYDFKGHVAAVLPGSSRSLMWTYPEEDERAYPGLEDIFSYICLRPEHSQRGPVEHQPSHEAARLAVASVKRDAAKTREHFIEFTKLPKHLSAEYKDKGLAHICWDEETARVCLVGDGDDYVRILDFARSPSVDSKGLRAVPFLDPKLF